MNPNRDSFSLDLRGYKDTQGARVPEGEYLVRVDTAEMVESKAGNQMVVLNYTVTTGPCADQTILDRLVLSEKAMWRVVEFLRACNIATPKRQLNISFKSIIGRSLLVTVSDGDEFMGRVRSEVRSYASAGVGATTSAPAADLPDTESATEAESAPVPPAQEADGAAPAAESAPAPAASESAQSAPLRVVESQGSVEVPEEAIQL